MKKLFAIAILTVAFAACNNSSESKSTEDTTAVKADTSTMTTPAPDTTHVDTSASKMKDTSAKK